MYYCQLFIDGVVRNLSEISSRGERGGVGGGKQGRFTVFFNKEGHEKNGHALHTCGSAGNSALFHICKLSYVLFPRRFKFPCVICSSNCTQYSFGTIHHYSAMIDS